MAARANYLAQDMPDIQSAARELCREMSDPTVKGWNGLTQKARMVFSFQSPIRAGIQETGQTAEIGNMGGYGLRGLQ